MRALVLYESMYGNTHVIADAIARGLESVAGTTVVSVSEATPAMLRGVDLVVVGGPTHGHGMSRPASREAAVASSHKPDSGLVVEPSATGAGVREWLESLGHVDARAAAFDTRVNWPVILSGRAATGIAKQLRRHGFALVADPESFLVTKNNQLLPDERARAERWGRQLGADLRAPSVA